MLIDVSQLGDTHLERSQVTLYKKVVIEGANLIKNLRTCNSVIREQRLQQAAREAGIGAVIGVPIFRTNSMEIMVRAGAPDCLIENFKQGVRSLFAWRPPVPSQYSSAAVRGGRPYGLEQY